MSGSMKSAVMPDRPFDKDSVHRKPSELGKLKKDSDKIGHFKSQENKLKSAHRMLHHPAKRYPRDDHGDSDSDSDGEDVVQERRSAAKALANEFSEAFAMVNATCLQPIAVNQTVSKDCQDALTKLTSLQDQYVSSTSTSSSPPPPPPHPRLFGPLVLVAAVVILIAKKVYFGRYRKFKRQQVHAVLRGIKNNPSLKASVEAEIGMPLPELPDHCRGENMGWCRRVAWTLSRVLIIVFISFTSAMIACRILMPHVHHDSSDGPPPPPPNLLLGAVLVAAIAVAELGLLFLVKKSLASVGICAEPQSSEQVPSPRYSDSPTGPRWNITGFYDQMTRPSADAQNLYAPLRSAPDVEMSSSRGHVTRGQPVQGPGYVYIAPASINPGQSVQYI